MKKILTIMMIIISSITITKGQQAAYKMPVKILYTIVDTTDAGFLQNCNDLELSTIVCGLNPAVHNTYLNVNATYGQYVIKDYFNPTVLEVFPDSASFAEQITLSNTRFEPLWSSEKNNFSTTAVANTLYKSISYTAPTQLQSDWNQVSTVAYDYVKNKPSIPSLTNYVAATLGSSTFNGVTLTTQYTITHSLGFTPSKIFIQPKSTNASALSYVDNITSTTFRITFLTIPVIGTNNISFDWVAYR